MSLLNRTSDGFHSSLTVIYKLLILEKKLSREKIIAYCAPQTLYAEDKKELIKHVRQTLNTWIKFGLFVKLESDEIAINPDVSKGNLSPERLPSVARVFVLKEDNNQNFFEKEGSGSADFIRLLAWSLMQDIWKHDQTSPKDVEKRLKKQSKEDSTFQQNEGRWPGLKAWAHFLGFAWISKHPASKFEPDSTIAIRDVLSEVFKNQMTLDAPTMITKLSEILPVLDGGTYWKMVEDCLVEREDEYSWRPMPPGHLSTSLSRSLLRLSEEGTLIFENRADSEHRLELTGRERSVVESVTHVTLKGYRV